MVIDKNDALARLAGNEDLLKMLISKFTTEYDAPSPKLQTLIEDNKMDEAVMLIHSIKGAAGNLSMIALAKTAKIIEEKLRSSQSLTTEDYAALTEDIEAVKLASYSL